MKIGILTHQYINNFGAFLQAYTLQEALKALFPDDEVRIIHYVNVKHAVINTGGWFRFYRGRENLRCWLQKIRLPGTFAKARRAHLSLTRRCFKAKAVNSMGFDCVIVGSDEVWNFRDHKAANSIKFGVGLTCGTLIAYAPSVGNTSAEDGVPEYVTEGLRRFSAVSARDDMTAALIRAVTGKTAARVLDPTFLAPCPRAELPGLREPYILFYYCDELPPALRKQIFEYAGAKGLAVYGAGECDRRYTRLTVNLTPFQWVEMFRRAAYVFTGTFHGTVFSILNHKPFKVYLTNASRVQKVRALLSELGLQNRELSAESLASLGSSEDAVDYEAVDRILDEKRSQSLAYLQESVRHGGQG